MFVNNKYTCINTYSAKFLLQHLHKVLLMVLHEVGTEQGVLNQEYTYYQRVLASPGVCMYVLCRDSW